MSDGLYIPRNCMMQIAPQGRWVSTPYCPATPVTELGSKERHWRYCNFPVKQQEFMRELFCSLIDSQYLHPSNLDNSVRLRVMNGGGEFRADQLLYAWLETEPGTVASISRIQFINAHLVIAFQCRFNIFVSSVSPLAFLMEKYHDVQELVTKYYDPISNPSQLITNDYANHEAEDAGE